MFPWVPTMDDVELLRRFEDLSLPRAEWTHRGHVRVAFCYLRKYAFPEALVRIRGSIKAYNAHHQVPENATSGYNETTTVAFLQLVATTMQAYGPAMPTPDSETFCDTHPHLLHRQLLRLFYSPAQRMHPDAKTRFVPPDLTPLPEIKPAVSLPPSIVAGQLVR